ncbi:MAG TPA: hypothetical protein ENO17_01675, partial [Candidatus Atribacteria bacterium]|nr:hypothetical protein [Candidatus Atribacteria bacterium]
FFGQKWNNAVILIQLLAISVIINMIITSNSSLFRAKGKVKLELQMQMVKTLFFFIPSIVIGTFYFGATGTALGFLLAKTLTVIYTLFFTQKHLKIKALDILRPSFKAIVLSGTPALFCYFLITQQVNQFGVIVIYLAIIPFVYHYFESPSVKRFKKIIFKSQS